MRLGFAVGRRLCQAELDGKRARPGICRTVVERQPVAAAVAAQVHRMTLKLSFEEALSLESLGYSMLLASEGFKTWRASRPVRVREDDPRPRVGLTREDGAVLASA